MMPLICLYEDRKTHTVAVKLLILSIQKFHPKVGIRLRFPAPPSDLIEWCKDFPQVTLKVDPLEGAGSYNIKPHMLLDGLDAGALMCLWLDTDIILSRPIPWLNEIGTDELISTLDPYPYESGSNYRAQAFGLEAQLNNVPGAINSAVVLVQQQHRDILDDWAALLKLPEYLHAQTQPVGVRNTMMLGDQDALSALIASKKFANLKVRLLKHPTDILHHQGVGTLSFSQRMKMKWTRNLPPLIHAMATTKPWIIKNSLGSSSTFKSYYENIFLETSPYVCTAREYRASLTENTSWLVPKTLYSKFMLSIFRKNSVAAGAFQSLFHQFFKKLQR